MSATKYKLDISEAEVKSASPTKVVLYVLFGIGIILIIVGLALIIVGAVKKSKECDSSNLPSTSVPPTTPAPTPVSQANFSSEALRVGFHKFLEEVKTTYYKSNPNSIVYNPDATPVLIKEVFSPYKCHPKDIKNRTDTARELYGRTIKISQMVDPAKLFPREAKALEQLKHFLQSNFGAPYDENYYAGDWLLGPNLFCWQPICAVGNDIKSHFTYKSKGFRPKTVDDVEFVINHLKQLNDSLTQYVENLKYGIKAGYIRSIEECKAGLGTMKRRFLTVALHGKQGILNASFVRDMRNAKWYADLEGTTKSSWKQNKGKEVEESIDESLVENVGLPLYNLLQYLELNHSRYCVPSNVSSGLANLPIDYVYFDAKKTNQTTTKVLPFGEKLNGSEAYKSILPYFTTTNMSPDEINKLGWSMLDKLYPKAIAIAREITGVNDSDQAVTDFKKKLSKMFFNENPIPDNETNEDAAMKCIDMASAKIHCSQRYASMLKWFDYVNGVLSLLAPKTVNMFHFTGAKQSTPNCPVQVVANFNPGTGSQSYSSSDRSCSRPCRYRLPFYLKDHGPIYNAYSVAAHEARPGHHTQVHSFVELFSDDRGDIISWLNGLSYYTAFTEGWALYAENPLITEETDTYDNLPLQKYGMLKWQIWRALRLIVDTGLHYKGMTRHEALELFAKYAWDRTDKAIKDVTRYQSDPGQATAYMIGQLAIWSYRNATSQRIEAQGKTFNEKDFHFQVLSQGSSPLSYLESHLKKFADCTIDPSTSGCNSILNPDFAAKRNKQTLEQVEMRSFTDDEDQDHVFFDGPPQDPRFFREHYD
ncbi:uncharacterized protein LOC116296565 [Actinia tenebrosa]|uniref:Uncharacterized protein LOC116296565 n=1 Tax=Actinia tenebrosa TaxID=6105 RepID=A0A6P8I637_ACTTE|nr:uncharacterized protein LOC116296565 [Actinia tenebrosa]